MTFCRKKTYKYVSEIWPITSLKEVHVLEVAIKPRISWVVRCAGSST